MPERKEGSGKQQGADRRKRREKSMEKNVVRADRKLMYEGSVIKVYQDKMQFAGGNEENWDYIHHDGAAAVVPVLPDGRILMVEQYRSALDRETLEIPAGKLDAPGEDPRLCAQRELEEETGYFCQEPKWLITVRTMVAFSNEKVEIYVAEDLIPSRQHLDENEFIHVSAYPLEELKEKIFRGEIQDSKTIAALLAYGEAYGKSRRTAN